MQPHNLSPPKEEWRWHRTDLAATQCSECQEAIPVGGTVWSHWTDDVSSAVSWVCTSCKILDTDDEPVVQTPCPESKPGVDLAGAVRLAGTIHTPRAAAELYKLIAREIDNNLDIEAGLYWDSASALQQLQANFGDGIADAAIAPMPVVHNRAGPPRMKERKPAPKPPRYRQRHPFRWAFAGLGILGCVAIKPVIFPPSPCPRGTNIENTSFQVLCVSDRNGDTIKVLQTYNP